MIHPQPATSSTSRLIAVLAISSAGLALAALPVFLVGGLAVQIRADLGFSATALGSAVTISFVTGALAGPVGGRVADRLGARTAVLIGAGLSSAALAGIALVADGWLEIAVALAVAGAAFSLIDPGLAILVSEAVPADRQGLALGVKEASIPIATLAAGVAVPVIALTLGWRWAFLVGLVPLAVLAVLLPRVSAPARRATPDSSAGERRRRVGAAVVLVAIGAALGSGAGAGAAVFLTESGVAAGLSEAAAGWLLAGGSIAAILTRLGVGIAADRTDRPQLGVVVTMLLVGGVAMTMAAFGSTPLLVVGAVGALAGAWGWSGLLFLVLIRARPDAPGAVAGVGLAGLAVGNAFGPLGFASLAQSAGYPAAWAAAGALAAVAAGVMAVARRRFEREARPEPRSPG